MLAEALCVTKHLTVPEKWKAPIPFGQQPFVPFAKQTSLQLKGPTVEGLIDNILSLEGLTTKLKEVVSSKIGLCTRCSFSVYETGMHEHDEILSKKKGKTSKVLDWRKQSKLSCWLLVQAVRHRKLYDYISEVEASTWMRFLHKF